LQVSDTHDGGVDCRLIGEVEVFADDLHELLAAVLIQPVEPFNVTVAAGRATHLVVRQQPEQGVALTVEGEPLLRLSAKFRCTWDSAREYLAVRESALALTSVASDTPLFRYDYLADADENVPGAHLNIYAHRDEVVFAMMAAGNRLRGKSRSYAVRGGRVPTVSTLHFPLGGHRFRPCLEDVLEFVVREFGIDRKEAWLAAVRSGRVAWRARQLGAAVRDDPAVAVAQLREMGCVVDDSQLDVTRRLERLEAL
jgi:hypothetical protein